MANDQKGLKLKETLGAVAAGVVGAAVGAAAVFLSNKENRDKIEDGMKDLQEGAVKKFEEFKKQAPTKLGLKKASKKKAKKS